MNISQSISAGLIIVASDPGDFPSREVTARLTVSKLLTEIESKSILGPQSEFEPLPTRRVDERRCSDERPLTCQASFPHVIRGFRVSDFPSLTSSARQWNGSDLSSSPAEGTESDTVERSLVFAGAWRSIQGPPRRKAARESACMKLACSAEDER
jgi:hypothetical protein